MLLRGNPRSVRRLFAEMKELPKRITERCQQFILRLGKLFGFCHQSSDLYQRAVEYQPRFDIYRATIYYQVLFMQTESIMPRAVDGKALGSVAPRKDQLADVSTDRRVLLLWSATTPVAWLVRFCWAALLSARMRLHEEENV